MKFTSNWCDKGLCMVAVAALALGWATTAAADDVPATGQLTCYKLERADQAVVDLGLLLSDALTPAYALGDPVYRNPRCSSGPTIVAPDHPDAQINDCPTLCTGTGQDGELRKGALLRFLDKGDGRILDQNTLVEWEKKSDDGSPQDKDETYTWEEALAYCQTLNNICEHRHPANPLIPIPCATDLDCQTAGVDGECGYSGKRDWRLPNVRELSNIVNFEVFSNPDFPTPTVNPVFNTNCVPFATVYNGSCTHADDIINGGANDGDFVPYGLVDPGTGERVGLRVPMTYWSSTSGDAPGDAWFVDYFTGDSGAHAKDKDLDIDQCPSLVAVDPAGINPGEQGLAVCSPPEVVFAGHARCARAGKR